MRKIQAVILCICFAASSAFAFSVVPKAKIDIPGTMNYEISDDEDTKRGFTIGLETRSDISSYFGCALGAEYLFPRGLKNIPGDNDFSFLPVYVSLFYYPFGAWNSVRPYVRVNGGFNVFAKSYGDADLEGRVYWAGGVGAEYKNFVGEVTGANYGGKYENGQEFKYQTIGISLGYKFNINIKK